MPYTFEFSQRFKKAYQKKNDEQKKRVDDTLTQLAADPRHPGLHAHRIIGTQDVWECYADVSMRVTFQYLPDSMLYLRNNCQHDAVLRRP